MTTTTTPETTEPPDLQKRIEARRAELIAKLVELRADHGLAAVEGRDKMKASLSEVAHIIKGGVVDGWTSLGDTVKRRLDHWLADTAPLLQVKGGPS